MKLRSVLFLLFLAMLGPPLMAQQQVNGNITTSGTGTDCATAGTCVVLSLNYTAGSATISLTGTFSATLQFEATGDSTVNNSSNWVAINATPVSSTTPATSATSTGLWTLNAANVTGLRVRCSTYASGTPVVIIRASSAASAKLGGTGGGSAFVSGAAGTGFQDVTEIAAPANPAAGVERLYSNNSTHTFACLTSTGTSCNPTAAPGGSNTQLLYNASGSQGGITGWTTNGTTSLAGTTTSVLDLHNETSTGGILFPGAFSTGITRVTTATGAVSSSELSGDITTSGSNAATLATVNSNVGSFTNANITVNGKGLVTAAANGTGGGLADPGANGPIKRTSLNVTAAAGFADIVGLWASGSCSGYLFNDGTCSTPGGSLPSGTQGLPLINSSGSTSYGTSGVWVDASQFSGADMCAKIDTARQSGSCASATLGCNIKAPFVGKQVCNTNPFAHWSNGGILQLGGAKNLDIRSSVTWNIPPNTRVVGTGATGSGGSSAVNNVILRAGNAAWQLGATNFAVPHEAISNASGACSGLNTQSSICISGTTAFVNVSNTLCNATTSPSYGQDVFIYGGPGIFAAFHGFAVNIAANNSNACVAGAATQFELQVPSGTSTCTSSCGTVYEGQPLLNLGLNPPTAAQYRTQLEGLSLDCAWTLGCLPLLNNGSEEDSWFRNVNFMNYGGEAFRLSEYTTAGFLSGGTTGGGASQSGPYSDFSINFLPETCEITANSGCNTTSTGVGTNNPLYETSGVSTNPQSQNPLGCFTTAIVVDGPRSSGGTTTVNHINKISSFTISASDPDPANVNSPNTPVAMNDATCGTPYTGHTTPIGILTWGAMVDFENFHIEDYPAEIQVGGNSALNAAYPGTTVGLSSQSTVTTNGVRISNGATSSASTNAWEVDLGANAGDIEVGKMTRFGGTHLLKDNVTSNTCTDKTLAAYFLGNGTNPNVVTTCNGLAQQFDGGINLIGATSGSFDLSATATGGTLNLGANATLTGAGALTVVSCSGCGGGLSGLTTGVVPQAGSATTIVNSSPLLDNGNTTANTLTYAGTGGIKASSGPLVSGLPAGGVGSSFFLQQEGTIPTGLSTAGQDDCYADSTQHGILCNFNAGTTLPMVQGPASDTSGHLATWSGTNGGKLVDGGAVPTGTVTSVATTAPITGGTITTSGTIACATCVVASSPGAGIAHFAGSTQTVTSSAIVAADITSATITHTQTDSTFPTLVASGTSAMGTGAITSGTCATVVTTTATGAATTDNLIANPTVDPTGVTGYAPSASGSLYIQSYITSGNANFKVCNNTSGSITPSALTMQWRVVR